jgi:general secretion pathway protein J
MRRNSGFTLLELLVALGLLGILAAALYGTYFSLMRGRERAEAVAERSRELRTTLDGLRRELAAAHYRAPAQGDEQKNPRFRFVVEDRDFFGKPASNLSFTYIAPPSFGTVPVSDQALVEYRPEAKDKAITLRRRERDIYHDAETTAGYARMENLQGFLVECFDGTKWDKTWDARLRGNTMPRQVRVTLTVQEGGRDVPYSAVVKLQEAQQ